MDFAAWIPWPLRLRNGWHKWILRKAVTPYMPHAVAWRGDKFHPATHFHRAVLQPVLERVLRDFAGSGPAIAGYVDRERFLREARLWQEGALEAVGNLAPLLCLEHWLRHNQDKVRFGQ